METNENIKTPKSKKFTARKNVVRIVISVLVIAVVVALFSSIGAEESFNSIYDIENNSNYQIVNSKNDALVVSYEGATYISKYGEVEGEIKNRMSSPRVDTSGKYVLLYDKNGKNVTMYDGAKKIYSYECDRLVKIAKVNKNGYALLISDETGYNSRISVLTPKGKIEYIWKIGDVYIVDADLSPDNKRIVATAISTETGEIVETIIFADIDKEQELSREENKNSMPLYANFGNNRYPVVVSDDKLCGYSSSGEKRWTVSFESKLLSSFEVDDKGNSVLALSGIKNNTVVETYTKNGRKMGEYVTDTKVKALSVSGKYIAILEPDKVSVINYSGRLVKECEVQKEYTDILILDKNTVILMGVGSIDMLKM